MEEQDDNQEQFSAIPEEQITQQQIVPFMGDDLAAAMTRQGAIYVTLLGMCNALGLDVKGQVRRIRRTKVLDSGLRLIPLETKGGVQRLNCLRVDKVALWLAGMQTKQVKPAYREKIEEYQERLAPIATQVFLQVMGIQAAAPAPSADPRLTALAEQYETIINVALFLQDHMNALAAVPEQIGAMGLQLEQAVKLLESLSQRQDSTDHVVAQLEVKSQGLTPAQQAKVREAVEIIARDSAGKPNELPYAQVYQALYKRFNVASYKQVSESQYPVVMQYLRELWRHATAGSVPEQGSIF